MKLLSYHLRVKRVSGLNKEDSTPKIENILIKLVGDTLFKKFCKGLAIRGYVRADPPKIEAVLERVKNKDGELSWKELGEEEIKKAQSIVDGILKAPKIAAKVDYKAEFEKQKQLNDGLEKRLKALEDKPKPGPKKKETSKLKENE